MGDFRFEVVATGGHGCDRDTSDGGEVKPCGADSCPDCVVRAFVETMRAKFSVKSAAFTHWPDTTAQVVDVYAVAQAKYGEPVTVRRRGSF